MTKIGRFMYIITYVFEGKISKEFMVDAYLFM